MLGAFRCFPGRRAVAAWVIALAALPALAAGDFEEGERLFREDKPKEAVARLERASAEAQPDERAWLYLGLAYQQLGRLDEAAGAFRKGSAQAARFKHLFFYDLGNVYALQGKNSFAIEMYGSALEIDPGFADALLNRAKAEAEAEAAA